MRNMLEWRTATLGAGLIALAACTSPTAPDPFGEPPEGTHQSALFALIGTGEGGTSVTPQPNPEGIFVATIRFRVRAKPNTTYVVQRAADVNRALNADGVCQKADGLPPWSPSDPPFGPNFVTFPLPGPGPLQTMTTNGAGQGSLDFEFRSAALTTGYRFDVRMRLIDSETAPTSELRSGCMTVEVR